MKTIKVKEIMVPLRDYATVSEDATLYEAVIALEEAQRRFDKDRYQHRAVLVFDKDRRIVGKLSQLDIIKGIESGYLKIGDLKGVSRSGFTPAYIKSLIKQHSLWQSPLRDICGKAAHMKVKSIMYTPEEGEYVEEEQTMDQAIHRLVMGGHQSLLVTRGGEVVGILRLTDVFSRVCEAVKACAFDPYTPPTSAS